MGKRKPVVVLSSSEDDEVRTRSAGRVRGQPLSATRKGTRGGRSKYGDDSSSDGRHSREAEAAKFAKLSEDFCVCLQDSNLTRGNEHTKFTELWIDKYKPSSIAQLAVHKKKVEEVKAWLEGRLITSKGNLGNVLLLTGQTGVGKSAAVRVIAPQLGAQLCEWTTPTPTLWKEHVHNVNSGSESLILKDKYVRKPLKMDAPEKVLSQAYGQARPVTDFLHENVLDFISDGAIDDTWMVTSYLSDADCLLGSSLHISSLRIFSEMYESQSLSQSVASSVAIRGVLFGNSQPVSSRWHTIRSPRLWLIEHSAKQHMNQAMNEKFDTFNGFTSSMSQIITEYRPSIRWLSSQTMDRLDSEKHAKPSISETRFPDHSCPEDSEDSNFEEKSEDEIEDW